MKQFTQGLLIGSLIYFVGVFMFSEILRIEKIRNYNSGYSDAMCDVIKILEDSNTCEVIIPEKTAKTWKW